MSPKAPLQRRIRARLLPFAGYLPAERGPAGVQRLAQKGRVAAANRLIRKNPSVALARLEAELTDDSPPSTVRSTASAAWATDDFVKAAGLYERLVTSGDGTAMDILRWARAGRKAESPQILARAQDAALSRVPADASELTKAVKTLKDAPADELGRVHDWRERIAAAHPELDLIDVDRLITDLQVHEALSDDHLDPAVVTDVLARDGGAAALVRSLLRSRRLDELEEQLGAFDASIAARVPDTLWQRVLKLAMSLGWTSLAARAAEFAPDQVEGDLRRRLAADAADEQAILADPWQPPAAAPAPASSELDPRSVVSVLGQSLPIRSGGYATRSHGILTGLAVQGWDMAAVTRLGFPFDLWWSADDERTPAPVDVVDGIPYHRLLEDGVREYPRAPLPPYVERGAAGIAELARDRRASLVHASSLYDVGMAGLSAARQLGLPFVYEMRGLKQLLEDARQPLFSASPRRDYLDLLEGTVAREADAVLVITEALGREMVRLGVDPERITVVPNGVDASRFTPRERDEELAQRLGVAGKTVIGYIGGLVHYEGLDLLFQAVAQLREQRSDFHVLVVGDGAHQKALHKIVMKLDLGDVITFTGRIPHEDVEDYLSLVDITPFPRKPLKVCEMISPIKPFESMAMRKTVVASDVAALAEIVQDGVTGRLFAKGDATDLARVLDELLDDPEQRDRLGEAARTWVVEERDWHKITSRVDGVYRGLLGQSSTEA